MPAHRDSLSPAAAPFYQTPHPQHHLGCPPIKHSFQSLLRGSTYCVRRILITRQMAAWVGPLLTMVLANALLGDAHPPPGGLRHKPRFAQMPPLLAAHQSNPALQCRRSRQYRFLLNSPPQAPLAKAESADEYGHGWLIQALHRHILGAFAPVNKADVKANRARCSKAPARFHRRKIRFLIHARLAAVLQIQYC